MATIKNLRNVLLNTASSTANGRLSGATVSISPGAATSLVIPKGNTVPVPSSLTLTATAYGYITPGYSWWYSFGTSGSWTKITGTTNTINLTLDATWLTAASTNTVVQYLVSVTETASGFTLGINQSQYILSIPIIREGADGVGSFNNLVVTLYSRTSTNTAPTVTTTGQATYYFNTATIIGQPSGWSSSIPDRSSGPYLWSIQVPVASTSIQYSFNNTLWSTPVLYGTDGVAGPTGNTTALVYAYKRSTTVPTDNPGAVDYSFLTSSITTATLANSWQKTIPTGTSTLYVVVATAVSSASTDSIGSTEWSSPVALASGSLTGLNAATVYLYARNNSLTTAPSLSVPGNLTYDFSTGTLSGTLPSGWTASMPALANGTVIWATHATAASTTVTDTLLSTEWKAPALSNITAERDIKTLYSSSSSYTSSWVYNSNAAGPSSYAVKATELIAAAAVADNILPVSPIAGDTVTFSNSVVSTFTGSLSGFVLTVSAVGSGTVQVGQSLSGANILAGTVITSFISGTNGGIGTYGISRSQTAASTAISAVSGSYIYTITHDGTSWKTPATTIDGSLLVTGSITASKINANGLEIRDASGNLILSAGNPLDWSMVGGTGKTTVETNASTALSTANTANTNASTALTTANSKLDKASSSILNVDTSSTVRVAGIRAGTLAWDVNGNYVSGTKGVAMTPGGLYAHNGTNITFALNSTTGAASFAGDLSAATGTFAGTLTAQAVNAVNTVNIANQAVTFPQSAYTAGTISSTTDVTIQSVTITSTGAPALIVFSAYIFCDVHEVLTYSLYRDGSLLYTVGGGGSYYQQIGGQQINCGTIIDQPSAGSHTYTLKIGNQGNGAWLYASGRCLSYLEVKR